MIKFLKKTALVLILLKTVILPVMAENVYRRAGTTGADFLKLGIGARAAGMGEAFTGMPGDISGIYYNPASLGFIDNYRGGLSHNIWFENISYDFVSGVLPTRFGIFAAHGRYLYYQDNIMETELDKNSLSPIPTGSNLKAYDAVYGLSYARSFQLAGYKDIVSLGININVINRRLASYTASAVSSDLGLLWNLIIKNKEFNVGFSIRNLGTSIDFGDEKERLPREFRLGVNSKISINRVHSLVTGLDLVQPFDNQLRVNLGMEYNINDILFLRAGYKITGYNLENLSAGFGFRIKSIQLDYAWEPYGGYFSNTHRVSLTFPIDKKRSHSQKKIRPLKITPWSFLDRSKRK